MNNEGKKFLIENLKKRTRRNSKDTIFVDLFSTPEYLLQLCQTLHPEMTDLTEEDIKILTLQSVMINNSYNDLGILVKDKLIILIEAQSTWTINILIRIMLYLASTYKEYIQSRDFNIYGTKKLDIPKPECYVVYTGGKKFDKDIFSLKEDFWCDSKADIDLSVKVIYAENKNDIIGQYIIFCHVLDEQLKIYGPNKLAVIETIRICQDKGVLKKYLEGKKKEVIDVMTMLFDEEYIIHAFLKEQLEEGLAKGLEKGLTKGLKRGLKQGLKEGIAEGKIQGQFEGKIQGVIETLRDLGFSINEIIQKVVAKFNISEDKAEKYVNEICSK